eukprot:Skav218609  [mRNA]  locus=scaffold3208:46922:48931:- [translate_table: standard]
MIHRGVLMITSVEEDLGRKQHLQGKKHHHGLYLVPSAVHEIAIENTTRAIWCPWHTEGVKQQQDITKLSVDISEDLARHIRLCQ